MSQPISVSVQMDAASFHDFAAFDIHPRHPLAHRAGQLIGDGVQNGRQVIHPLACGIGKV